MLTHNKSLVIGLEQKTENHKFRIGISVAAAVI
jgi:hypothetical protein